MKRFRCRCGQAIYFESHHCIACGAVLGFDPDTLMMRSLSADGERLVDADGAAFMLCVNGATHGVCNWLVAADSTDERCFGCRFNRTIPGLDKPANLARWHKLEASKKRLFFTLLSLGLPLKDGHEDPEHGLLLDFMEDSRSDPARFPESFVSTGYLGGIVTINALEADDAAREAVRVELGESYRTVLGHLRHESGHYYWGLFNADAAEQQAFAALFGDPTADYQAAIEAYYSYGPAPDWSASHISPYASVHPVEDWAESWGHYLHIHDVLETAAAYGVAAAGAETGGIREAIAIWRSVSVTLNELNRSIGLGDAYPFVVNQAVEEKLVYVDSVIHRLQGKG